MFESESILQYFDPLNAQNLKRTNKPKLWLLIICDIIRMMIISYGNYVTETRMKCSLGSSVGSVGASAILPTLIYEIYITMDDI